MALYRAALGAMVLCGVLTSSTHADPGDFIDVFVSPGSGGLEWPSALTFGPDGNLYVVGPQTPWTGPWNVVRYDGVTGEFIDVFTSGSYMVFPRGLTFGPDGNLYVTDGNHVKRYNGTTGAFIDVFVAVHDTLADAWHLTFGPDGNLYVASYWSDLVARFDGTTGEFMDVFASGEELSGPTGLTFGPDGNLYVSSAGGKILRYDGASGAFIDVFASGGNALSGLRFGPCGDLYVCDFWGKVFLYNGTTGEFVARFVSGLQGPMDLTFGPDGNLYVTDDIAGPGALDVVLRYEGPDPTCGIPTVSAWGVLAMTLLLLTAGTILIARRRVACLGEARTCST